MKTTDQLKSIAKYFGWEYKSEQISEIHNLLQLKKKEVADYIKGLDSVPWDEQVDEELEKIFD